MDKANTMLAGGVGSWLYSMIGPATDVIQFLTAILGLVAVALAIWLKAKQIKKEK